MHVFAYGSLLGLPATALPARLRGFARRWGVAMDNRRTIPGYKLYLDAATGERPPVFVTFLDIEQDPGAWLNGVVLAVAAELLPALDRRERNYERHDVAELLDADFGAPVWAYVGRAEARERCRRGRAAGTAVVSRAYHDKVRAGFASFGGDMLRDFDRTTEPLELPLRELRRVDVADGGRRPAAEGVI